jgi:biotin operon repressor
VDDGRSTGVRRLVDGLPAPDAARAAEVIARSAALDLEPGVPHFRTDFDGAALLLVAEGFVVVRATSSRLPRSVITCEAGVGRILLPPRPEEVLFALGRSRLDVISAERRDLLLALPTVAGRVVEQLASALAPEQEAIANFAQTRHVDRVRSKLLQLARTYGHVVRDGVRIDFPVSHTVLAEMIGSSRETVTRAVDELQRDGFVARRGHTYRLLVSPECVLGPPAAEL